MKDMTDYVVSRGEDMFKSCLVKIFIFFLLLPNVSCQQKKMREVKTPIRIIDSGIVFDGGTVVIHYLNQEDELIKVSINKGIVLKDSPHKSDFGRIYLNINPDGVNYVKDNKVILRTISDLINWHNYNIKIYTNLSIADYSSDLKSRFKEDFIDSHYENFLFETAEYVERALNLIKGKYPELYMIAEKL